MKNRKLLVIVLIFASILLLLFAITRISRSRPSIINELSSTENVRGTITVINDRTYLVNFNELSEIVNNEIKPLKTFAGTSQVLLNQLGGYVAESSFNTTNIYELESFKKVKTVAGRYFSWLDDDSYFFTNTVAQNIQGTDALSTNEKGYIGTVNSSRNTEISSTPLISGMLLSNEIGPIVAYSPSLSDENVLVNQLSKDSQKIVNNLGTLEEFTYERFQTHKLTLIQEGKPGVKNLKILRNGSILETSLRRPANEVIVYNDATLLYFIKNTDPTNGTAIIAYDITNRNHTKVGEIGVSLTDIQNVAINKNILYIITSSTLLTFNIEQVTL